jgi:Ca2+-binding RTX toxin-like protein
MATINSTASNDMIIPSVNEGTYRGLGGNDTYIITNAIEAGAKVTIVDTAGANVIQLVDGLSIASSKFAGDSVQLTLSNGAVVTVNGADKFTFEVGGNLTTATTGSSNTYAELASAMGVASLPTGSTISDGTSGTVSGSALSSGSVSYTLSAGASSVAEGSSITYTITASSAPTSDTTLTYNVIGDTNGGSVDKATSGDLVSLSGTVTIAAGSTSATFTVTPNTDETNEGLEGIKVSVFDASNDVIGSATALISNTASAASTTSNLTTGVDTLSAGEGDNTVGGTVSAANGTGSTLQPGDVIDGGAGADVLKLSLSGTLTGDHSISGVEMSNVEEIQINGFQTADGQDYTLDMALITGVTTLGLVSSSASNDITISNVPTIVNVKAMNGGGDLTVTYAATASAGVADIQALNVNNYTGTVSLAGVETINLDSSGVKSTIAALTATSMTSLNVTGDAKLTITGAIENGTTTLDASAHTGGGSYTLTPTATTGITFTGGSGNETAIVGASLSQLTSIDGGAGVDTMSISDADTLTVLTGPMVSNVEVLDASATDATEYNTSFLPGVTALSSSAATDGITSTQVTFSYMDAENSTITVSGTEDVTATLAIDGAADSINATVGLATQASLTNVDTNLADFETINLTGGVLTATGVTITLFGGADLQTLNVSGGKVTISGWNGGTLLSTIDASASSALVMGSNPATTFGVAVTGGAGNDTLYGGTKADTVVGGAGNDIILGGASGDTITGGAGNDVLTGQGGVDIINGGAGNDTIHVDVLANFEDLATAEQVDGGEGTDTLNFGAAVAHTTSAADLAGISNIEVITYDTTSTGTITLDDAVFTNAGVTNLDIRDTEATASLTVTASALSAANSVTVTDNGGNITSSYTGGAGDDTFKVTINHATALAAADTITGGKGTDELIVTAGNASLTQATQSGVTALEKITFVGTAAKTIGYTLDDATFVTTALAAVSGVVDASGMTGSGALTFIGTAEDDSGMTITGGKGGDTLTGGESTTFGDTISGGSGADIIDGGAGIDTLSGGDGNDQFTVSTNAEFIGLTSAESVDGGTGIDILDFEDDAASATITAADLGGIKNIEYIYLSGNDAASITVSDTVFSNNGSTSLRISREDDTVVNFTVSAGGLSSANSLDVRPADGGSSTDIITLGAGNDTVWYANGAHFDTADTINGGAGTDSIVVLQAGTAHSATYTNISNIEAITYTQVNGGTVTATLADANFVSQTLASVSGVGLVTALSFTGTAENDSSINLTGGTAGDTLIGTDTTTLGDTISGNGGADTIDGSKGGDILTGGAGADTFDYNAVADSNSSTKDSITDYLSGTDKLTITLDYSSLTTATTITADVTAAKAGKTAVQDSLTGERGQTVYDTTNSELYVNYNADNLLTSLDYNIAINAGATATTTVADADITWTITGGSGADIITGNVNADTISGGDGADVITAGDGADIINLGGGTDTLNSGKGADIVTMTVDAAVDTIKLQTNELATDGTAVDGGSVDVDTLINFLAGANKDKVQISLSAIEAMSGVIDLIDAGLSTNSTAAGDTMVVTDGGTGTYNLSGATTAIIVVLQAVGTLSESGLEDLIEDNAANDLIASGAQAVGDAYLLLADDGTDSALYLVVIGTAIADNGPIAANGANLVKLLTFDGQAAAQALVSTNFEIIA